MTKRTEQKSKIAVPPKARKLTVKRDTLKDLTSPQGRDQHVKGGARTQSCASTINI